MELLAFHREIQLTLSISLMRILAIPETAIPDQHRAAAILALRNGALEVAIVERVVLDLHRKSLVVPGRGTDLW